MTNYIYQQEDWPNFTWDDKNLIFSLGRVRNLQGKLIGKMTSFGVLQENEAILKTMTLDIIKSSEIEGEKLNLEQVRSSVARHLKINISGMVPSGRDVDGMVEMITDATQNYQKPLTKERLFSWHTALFPDGQSGIHPIAIGDWRKDENGPMLVVSGHAGKEKIHYQAPEASAIPAEMHQFLSWVNQEENGRDESRTDPVIKAGVAHLWFVTIHPFDDGNGRIARAISDLLLARADGSAQRFYSLSAQIQKERKNYYAMLEKTQKGTTDITEWLSWFLNCLERALIEADNILKKILQKADFWKTHAQTPLNERQRLMINKLLDGFDGKLQTSKWAKITKCSTDTALRDIKDLIGKDILKQDPKGGRSTSYILVEFEKP
ncbi:Fic family protein [Methanolapillus millepedarum]|uniref:Fido domain-containing protein n=1 Tax=Methanolapillus millepedarum TaxID=3028296 RepID=A0AA96ZTZ0_9EURY|nr:hypothetical protein MsAc7_06720 [Methanosarcinaceae archaeon Ac7]